MRGTPAVEGVLHVRHGIIPAHAGNTDISVVFWNKRRDHPRTCGEHIGVLKMIPEISGSSPHMRGTLAASKSYSAAARIIPAHAGNTAFRAFRSGLSEDHPRTCGEHATANITALIPAGSSPHMRGTPIGGISIEPEQNHPRTCGEHEGLTLHDASELESSPHMRGTLNYYCHSLPLFRIIPAHAGNTWTEDLEDAEDRNHPRTCGEHRVTAVTGGIAKESSPHMRGTL